MTTPTISVIVPTHNRPERVRKAVQSVLAQTFQDLEVIVVDDGMERRADAALQEIHDARVMYLQHDKNKGAAAARNTGIRAARAPYIAFLDDDDVYLPRKLEIQYQALRKHEAIIDFVFSAVAMYHERLGEPREQRYVREGIGNFYEQLLAHRLRILTPSVLIKRSVLEKVGGFDERLPSNQEWDLLIRVAQESKGYYMDVVVARAHIGAGADHIGGNLEKRIKGRELLLHKHYTALQQRPIVLANHYFWLGLLCRDNGEFRKARSYFFKAWLHHKLIMRFLAHGLNVLSGQHTFFKRTPGKILS